MKSKVFHISAKQGLSKFSLFHDTYMGT